MGEPAAAPGRIAPRLTTFDAAMVVFSLVVGIGIFRTPALVARDAGPRMFLAVWAIGGAVSFAGALVFAEIGSRFPRAGGYYGVVAHCWHPALAFVLNWAQAIMQGAGAAGVALIGAEYLLRAGGTPAAPGGGLSATLAAATLIALLLALNAAGVRSGARTQNLLSVAKMVMILGLAAAGLLMAKAAASGAPAAAAISTHGMAPRWPLIAALVAVFYTFGGYQCAMNIAGDVRDARRNLPRALLLGMAAVTGLYLMLNAAYQRVLGPGVATSDLVAADLARACFGPGGETLLSLAIFLSAAGFVNATILQVPRSFLAMAEDGVLPQAFLGVNPRTQVQGAGLAFFGVTMLGPLLLLGTFEKLLDYVMFTDSITVAVAASCIFVLRRRGTGGGDVFRAPGYPVLPVVVVAFLGALAVQIAMTRPALALAGGAVLAAGGPLFLVLRRVSGTKPRPAGPGSFR